ncbi:hypothetical protein DY000_02045272 [Brassica cretica]|uniref:Uncharacterized protein n=1 Tax=Brassica cretica TaxID=69181 RepID=A0ABQ7F1E0_BRACR|nr:hypothetical protein DY000_02045272 [Brassica cretica]
MAGLCIGVTYPLVDDRLLAVGPTPSSSVLDYQLLALVFDGGGLYRMLLGLLFFVPSLFQLILASIGSTTVFDWNSFIERGVRFWL